MDEHLVAINEPHSAMLLPAKYVQNLERNQILNLCCRHVEEEGHTAQWFATPSAQEHQRTPEGEIIPDVLVVTCGQCGRKHRTFFVGDGTRSVIKDAR